MVNYQAVGVAQQILSDHATGYFVVGLSEIVAIYISVILLSLFVFAFSYTYGAKEMRRELFEHGQAWVQKEYRNHYLKWKNKIQS